MKVQLWKGQDGNVLSKTAHNNRAPGLLRVFITDHRVTGATAKMADIKKNADFVKVIAEYLQKPVESIVLRFNTNLMVDTEFGGRKYAGILVQDALNKFQNANAPEVDVDIFSDDQDIDTVLAAEEAAIAEVPETQIAPADEATAEVNENTPPELA